MPTLIQKWREARGLTATPNAELNFQAFYAWVQENYPAYLKFRSRTSVRNVVEMWFEKELGLPSSL